MILVTGATGYLGKHVLLNLSRRGLDFVATSRQGDLPSCLPCDLMAGDVAELLMRVRPDFIIHCAAHVPKTPEDYTNEELAAASVLMASRLSAARHALDISLPRIIFASSMTAEDPATSAYAYGKYFAEQLLPLRVVMRLPGLFGLPRRSGVIYKAARSGVIPESFGPYPAMHVADAAEYLVRAAVDSGLGRVAPFSVVYGDRRLEACYGTLGVTFDQRVREFVDQVQSEARCPSS